MNDNSKKEQIISAKAQAEIDLWVEKYLPEQKQSAVLAALTIVQEENGGYLNEALLEAIADYLDMPRIAVFEVATFYTMFDLQPVGKYKINVCTNISCQLCGSHKIVEHLQHRLGIKLGETTPDQRFTLRGVECLAACTNAPMMQIGKHYYEDLTPEKVDDILQKLTESES